MTNSNRGSIASIDSAIYASEEELIAKQNAANDLEYEKTSQEFLEEDLTGIRLNIGIKSAETVLTTGENLRDIINIAAATLAQIAKYTLIIGSFMRLMVSLAEAYDAWRNEKDLIARKAKIAAALFKAALALGSCTIEILLAFIAPHLAASALTALAIITPAAFIASYGSAVAIDSYELHETKTKMKADKEKFTEKFNNQLKYNAEADRSAPIPTYNSGRQQREDKTDENESRTKSKEEGSSADILFEKIKLHKKKHRYQSIRLACNVATVVSGIIALTAISLATAGLAIPVAAAITGIAVGIAGAICSVINTVNRRREIKKQEKNNEKLKLTRRDAINSSDVEVRDRLLSSQVSRHDSDDAQPHEYKNDNIERTSLNNSLPASPSNNGSNNSSLSNNSFFADQANNRHSAEEEKSVASYSPRHSLASN